MQEKSPEKLTAGCELRKALWGGRKMENRDDGGKVEELHDQVQLKWQDEVRRLTVSRLA